MQPTKDFTFSPTINKGTYKTGRATTDPALDQTSERQQTTERALSPAAVRIIPFHRVECCFAGTVLRIDLGAVLQVHE